MKKRVKTFLTLGVFLLALLTSPLYAFAEVPEDDSLEGEYAVMSDNLLELSSEMSLTSYAFNDGSYLYYDQLDPNNKAAYDAMRDNWMEPNTSPIAITLPETITYQAKSTSIESWPDTQKAEFWDMIFGNLKYGENALMFDYPEVFWFDTSNIKVAIGSVKTTKNIFTGLYTMKISKVTVQGSLKKTYEDIESAQSYIDILRDSVDAFETQGSDRYQIIKYFHDYICETVCYNATAPFRDSSVGLFCEPYQVVCEGYSKAMKILCDKADIPCVIVTGNVVSETKIGHMWNYVMMEDGLWYGVDCTWDDTDSPLNPIRYSFFLKGSENFTGHTNEDIFTFPEMSFYDYEYIPPATEPTTVPTTTTTATTTTTTTTAPPYTPETTTTEVTIVIIPGHIKGDCNNDGAVNSADLVLLRRYLTGQADWSVYIDDMNGDSVINVYDCVVLTRIILKGV